MRAMLRRWVVAALLAGLGLPGVARADGTVVTPPKPPEQRGPYRDWHPDVYVWGKDLPILGFVGGGVFLGVLIGGLAVVEERREHNLERYSWDSHIPPYGRAEHRADEVVPDYTGEFLMVAGIQGALPCFGVTVPTVAVAASGADLQVVKAVASFATAATMLPTGFVHLGRFRETFLPQIEQYRGAQDDDRLFYLPPGGVSIALAVTDLSVGTVMLVNGLLLATDARQATTADGLLSRRGPLPFAAPSPEGGVAFGLEGRW